MRFEWSKVLLSEIADLTVGFVGTMAQHYVEDGITFLRSTNIEPFKINLGDVKYISPEFHQQIRKSQLNSGDVVIVRTGKPGACTVIPAIKSSWNCSDLVIIHPNKEKILPLYLASYINLAYGVINANLVGAVQQHFNVGSAKKLIIDLPPISIQSQIVAIIQAFNDKIELNQKINDNLERQAQIWFTERFSGFTKDSLPDGWKMVRLGDVAVICNKSFNPVKESETLLEHYSIPAFDETRFPEFELSSNIKSNKFLIDANCFMISKLNPTTKRVWKPYCVSNQAVCSTEFIVYKARERSLTDFLYSLIDSESFSDFMCSHVTGSTGSRQRTTPSDTLQFEFALPPTDEIMEFTAIVQPMYQQIKVNFIENDRLKRLRDTLLPKLMSGSIETVRRK